MNAHLPVSSPCIDICLMDPGTGLCTGCARSLDEIAGWGSLSEADRRAIMATLPARLDALGSRAAGRDEALAKIRAVLAR